MIGRHDIAVSDEPMRILIVDDEPNIANLLRVGLKYEGYSVAVAEDGPSALQAVSRFNPHLVILDLMLPGLDGIEVAKRLRQDPEILIIMLTARDQVPDRIAGLEAGGDDYVVKPFVFEELLARIRTLARRRWPARAEILQAGPIMLDQERHVVTVNGSIVKLSLKEYSLLQFFMMNPRRVLSRQLLLDRVWGYDFFGDENNVEVYVGYLRRKLGDDGRDLIETVRGIGYRLAV
ncbi:MAG TPA: response regulator transcription factor [Chloroflexota bacterium]